MMRTFRFPLRPSKVQATSLDEAIWACRDLYNAALEQRRDAYRKQRVSLSRYDQQKEITALRSDDPRFGSIAAVILRSATTRVDRGYQAFFRRVKSGEKPGFPRFKGRGRYTSFSFPNPVVNGSTVKVPKIGLIRFKKYRELRGTLKECSVSMTPNGWEVTFACDLGEAPPKVTPQTIVGVDVGIRNFTALSSGEMIPNPRYFKTGASLIAQRARKLSKKRRGSKTRDRARRLLAKAHRKIRNQRLDHARKLAKEIVQKHDVVAYEKLKIAKMVEGHFLAKPIHDAAWGSFLSCLISKAEEAGKWAVGVDPKDTTNMCSACGVIVEKTLRDLVHVCHGCGLRMDRDLNAAINIQALGWSAVSSALAKARTVAEVQGGTR